MVGLQRAIFWGPGLCCPIPASVALRSATEVPVTGGPSFLKKIKFFEVTLVNNNI